MIDDHPSMFQVEMSTVVGKLTSCIFAGVPTGIPAVSPHMKST